jgi:hypothetical protein
MIRLLACKFENGIFRFDFGKEWIKAITIQVKKIWLKEGFSVRM